MKDIHYWYWLSSVEAVGPSTLFPLLMYLGMDEKERGSFEATSMKIDEECCKKGAHRLFHSTADEMMSYPFLSEKKAGILAKSRDERKIIASFKGMKELEMHYIPYISPAYPKALKQLYDPPIGIFYRGALPADDEWMLAVVGARACSSYGRSVTKTLCRSLTYSGISIISGMARGIDSQAQKSCIEAGGRTYAVLGCGADVCYPPENIDIYEEILDSGGGIISEYPPGSMAHNFHFPMRNRIIAALSKGIVIIEARKKSGSLITAERGLELGREIFAVPGRVGDKLSEGCNELIKIGASLVTGPSDILDSYGLLAREYTRQNVSMDNTERKVFSAIGLLPKSPEEIALSSGLDISLVSRTLTMLEIKGLIHCMGKSQYIVNV